MSDDEDKKIVETNNESQNDSETNSDLQPEMSNASSDSNPNTENQPKDENNQENKVIHKKEGRLHIYVRQDKYKGLEDYTLTENKKYLLQVLKT